MLATLFQPHMVNMISLCLSKAKKLLSIFYLYIYLYIFIFISLTKQALEQQIVNWYFGKVFIEDVMGLFLLYFCIRICIYSWEYMWLSNFKNHLWGVGTMVRVLGSRWVDRHLKIINSLLFLCCQGCTHVYGRDDMATFIKIQKAFIFLDFSSKTTMIP